MKRLLSALLALACLLPTNVSAATKLQFEAGTMLQRVVAVYSSDAPSLTAGRSFTEKWNSTSFRGKYLFIQAELQRKGKPVTALLTVAKQGGRIGKLVPVHVPAALVTLWNGVKLAPNKTYYVEQGEKMAFTTVTVQQETLHLAERNAVVTEALTINPTARGKELPFVDEQKKERPLSLEHISWAQSPRYLIHQTVRAIRSDIADFHVTTIDRNVGLQYQHANYLKEDAIQFAPWRLTPMTVSVDNDYLLIRHNVESGHFTPFSNWKKQLTVTVQNSSGQTVGKGTLQAEQKTHSTYMLPDEIRAGEYNVIVTSRANGAVTTTQQVKWYPYITVDYFDNFWNVAVEWKKQKYSWQQFQAALRQLALDEKITARLIYTFGEEMIVAPFKTVAAKEWMNEYTPNFDERSLVTVSAADGYGLFLLNDASTTTLLDEHTFIGEFPSISTVGKGDPVEWAQLSLNEAGWRIVRPDKSTFTASTQLNAPKSGWHTYSIRQTDKAFPIGVIFEDGQRLVLPLPMEKNQLTMQSNRPLTKIIYYKDGYVWSAPATETYTLNSKVSAVVRNRQLQLTYDGLPVQLAYATKTTFAIKQGNETIMSGEASRLNELITSLPNGTYRLVTTQFDRLSYVSTSSEIPLIVEN